MELTRTVVFYDSQHHTNYFSLTFSKSNQRHKTPFFTLKALRVFFRLIVSFLVKLWPVKTTHLLRNLCKTYSFCIHLLMKKYNKWLINCMESLINIANNSTSFSSIFFRLVNAHSVVFLKPYVKGVHFLDLMAKKRRFKKSPPILL